MLKGKGLLTALQRTILDLFSSLPDQEQFYLTGGTALAEFYLGHRRSYDLDFFTAERELILPLSYEIEQQAPRYRLSTDITRRFKTFVQMVIAHKHDEVKVDLALDSPYRFEDVVYSTQGVLINDFVDLRVDKVLAYFGRAEPRDAVDLYFLLQEADVRKLLGQARQKDPGFDLYWFTIALNRVQEFPDDLGRWPVDMILPLNPADLKRTFQTLAMQLMKQVTDASYEASDPPIES